MTTATDSRRSDKTPTAQNAALRALGLTALLACEFLLLVRFYRAQALPDAADGSAWLEANALVMKAAFLGLNIGAVIVVALVLVNWTQRRDMIAAWAAAQNGRSWQPWVFWNLVVFAATTFGAVALNLHLATGGSPPWLAFGAWCGGAALLAPLLALAFAPVRYWLELIRTQRLAIGAAIVVALTASVLMQISVRLWDVLADLTLLASSWVLGLYEQSVSHDLATNVLVVDDFGVLIGAPCSGLEGMGLVTTFLALFIWAFRRELRFPNALFILPIGIAASWCLNVARIVVLASVGAHFSRSVALGGFHDHAGWLMFLIASVSLMFATYKISFFRARDLSKAPAVLDLGVRLTLAYLLPLVAIIAVGVLVKSFAENPQPFYPLSIGAAVAVMWPYRDVYRGLIAKPQLISIAAGLLVGVGWILTDPAKNDPSTLGAWLASLPLWIAVPWLCARVIGASIVVPIAEELAFRGYLHRALIARRFEAVEPRHFAWLAFIVSTSLFAVMHGRWLSAAIAGAVYALVMYRSNKVSDAIVAHAVSNASIAAWAIGFGQWSLL